MLITRDAYFEWLRPFAWYTCLAVILPLLLTACIVVLPYVFFDLLPEKAPKNLLAKLGYYALKIFLGFSVALSLPVLIAIAFASAAVGIMGALIGCALGVLLSPLLFFKNREQTQLTTELASQSAKISPIAKDKPPLDNDAGLSVFKGYSFERNKEEYYIKHAEEEYSLEEIADYVSGHKKAWDCHFRLINPTQTGETRIFFQGQVYCLDKQAAIQANNEKAILYQGQWYRPIQDEKKPAKSPWFLSKFLKRRQEKEMPKAELLTSSKERLQR